MRERFDFVIVGAGIAGAGAAYALAQHGSCLLLERESQPGYHTTGRSAALFSETYGNAPIRALTVASRDFLMSPPEGFADVPILTPRGVMMVGAAEKSAQLDATYEEMRKLVASVRRIPASEVLERVPVLRPEQVAGGAMDEPEGMDIDVHALHRGFLRAAARAGSKLVNDAEVTALQRDGADWIVATTAGEFTAGIVVNAAGAWADVIGGLAGAKPIGLEPKRRTAFTIDVPNCDFQHWPMVFEADEAVYFKPDAGRLLISPCDEIPSEPCDAQPDEMDIALAAEAFETLTTLTVRRPAAKWAGLRSFVADRSIVAGFDADQPGFFWLAAQGGYGIQTSGAMSRVAGALVRGQALPADIQDLGITEAVLSPKRLR
ncbi:FAD-binding oxidoreductase [Ferrovibrio sp.]|uniref:NAD(P)/FAD-dependent oxidoreductase n=1 Tax=Ferrovibrio sp. TaxID=1917215 RepID=UPI0025BED82C|nr:FAD-binding oxidoreductase [Ferrovibrio sp.]MBX3456498.1 FAD-binding oxidoreductase [Ferrovibrio sp.]